MKNFRFESYFRSSTYAGYLLRRPREGGLWQTASKLYKSIRKYTFISGLIKTFYFVLLLIEKSAILLLMVSVLILFIPLLFLAALIYVSMCIIKYIKHRKEISAWLENASKITVYLTNEKIFVKDAKLFLRDASFEASAYSHPVIVLCTDRFISLRWYGINLLGVRSDYFFLIKKHFLSKTPGIINYIALF